MNGPSYEYICLFVCNTGLRAVPENNVQGGETTLLFAVTGWWGSGKKLCTGWLGYKCLVKFFAVTGWWGSGETSCTGWWGSKKVGAHPPVLYFLEQPLAERMVLTVCQFNQLRSQIHTDVAL